MVVGSPHGKWQSKWIPPNAKCNCTQMLIFHLLCIQNLFFFAADVHLFYCPVLPHYIWNESTFSMNPRESIIRFGVVCVYKCGSNEVVSPVTTLPALRGSLIYHSNAPPPAFYLSLPWTAYTSGWWFLKLWALRWRGGVLGWWQGQMGSVMGHSHHRRPPSACCCTDRLEKQGGRRALPLPPLASLLKIVSTLDSPSIWPPTVTLSLSHLLVHKSFQGSLKDDFRKITALVAWVTASLWETWWWWWQW